VVTATIEDLYQEVKKAALTSPALLVVGEVVSLREKLNWFEKRSLFGKTILITRTRDQAGRLSAALRELGARVSERPAIEIRPIRPNHNLERALYNLSTYQYLILTSPNGATIFMKALQNLGLDSRALHNLKIAVIGPGTAEALSPFGLKADLMPKSFISEGLLELFSSLPHGKVLLARAKEGRDTLAEGLKKFHFDLDLIPLYETISADWSGFEKLSFNWYNNDSYKNQRLSVGSLSIDLATLTSASTARGLAVHISEENRSSVPVVSIGPITTKAAVDLGFKVVSEASHSTIDSLVEAITQYLSPCYIQSDL
jgi:uroporphyrinogen III methyltransferase/synthase